MHHRLVGGASLKYNLTRDQLPAEVLQKYLRERKYQAKQKNIIERDEQIVKFYEELRDWSDSLSSGLFYYQSLTSASKYFNKNSYTSIGIYKLIGNNLVIPLNFEIKVLNMIRPLPLTPQLALPDLHSSPGQISPGEHSPRTSELSDLSGYFYRAYITGKDKP